MEAYARLLGDGGLPTTVKFPETGVPNLGPKPSTLAGQACKGRVTASQRRIRGVRD